MAGAKYSPGFDDPSARPVAHALRRWILGATLVVALAATVAIALWFWPMLG